MDINKFDYSKSVRQRLSPLQKAGIKFSSALSSLSPDNPEQAAIIKQICDNLR